MRNTTVYSEAVAGEIRAALARRNLPQRWLVAQLPLSASTLSRKMAGRIPFDVGEVVVIAELLGIDPATLMPPLTEDAA